MYDQDKALIYGAGFFVTSTLYNATTISIRLVGYMYANFRDALEILALADSLEDSPALKACMQAVAFVPAAIIGAVKGVFDTIANALTMQAVTIVDALDISESVYIKDFDTFVDSAMEKISEMTFGDLKEQMAQDRQR